MTKTTHDEMTNTYRVEKTGGGFDSYTPNQYKEKFGKLPEEVEDVTDEVVAEPEVVAEEEAVTSIDGTETVLASDIKEGLKNFGELSPEEQEKVKVEQEASQSQNTPSTGGVLGAIKDVITPNKE